MAADEAFQGAGVALRDGQGRIGPSLVLPRVDQVRHQQAIPDHPVHSHRGHHQFLAKAITHVTKGSLDLTALVTPEVQEVLQRTLAEILGLAQGYCAGRGGSMHLQWLEAGALGTNAIVGATVRDEHRESVGKVEDIYVDNTGAIKAVVVSVGGFLGVGAKDVAVKWNELKFSRDGKSLVITTTQDSLKAMPDSK